MLEPDSRAILTEQLRPPAGFHLTQAVATTFTLDLTSALAIPLAFASHQVRKQSSDPAILDAVRRASDRIDIFAQAGQIAVPSSASDLVAFLELMVHPVAAPRSGGLFHPKVWVLEYGHATERRYRMLCTSRNLTADRTWDVVVRLDGMVVTTGTSPDDAPRSAVASDRESRDAIGPNGTELAEFVAALPGMRVLPMQPSRAIRVIDLAARLRAVRWDPPADFNRVIFHPFGVPGIRPPDLDGLFDGKRHLVISPFLSDDGLGTVIPNRSRERYVLSRKESLDQLRPTTLDRLQTFVLDDAIRDDASDADELVGLHAKVYVLDRLDGSHMIVGSANATEGAFHRNVEMLIDLRGSSTKIGVAALFGEEAPLRGITLEVATEGGIEPSADDKAERRLERAVRQIAMSGLRAIVHGEAPSYELEMHRLDSITVDDEFTLRMRPLTLPGRSHELPGAGHPVTIPGLELTQITPFFVISVADERGIERSTVVTADLVGDIDGRRDAIIARQIIDRETFLQLLALLLAFSDEGEDAALAALGRWSGAWGTDGSGLFETLVRAVGAGHRGLDDVKRVIDQLTSQRGADDDQVIPEGFPELWDAVWQAHRAASRRPARRKRSNG